MNIIKTPPRDQLPYNTYGIICEYNPFHFGHRYQLDFIRSRSPGAAVVCLMSGCFTQRGEPAAHDKYDRAEAAVRNGADLVLELPFPWCMASAEYFADASVEVLSSLGMIGRLCFGSESGDISALRTAAARLDSDEFRIPRDRGEGAAAAIYKRYCEIFGEPQAALIRCPNNILAIEYIRAIARRGNVIEPVTLRRSGGGYNSTAPGDGFASAGALRRMIADGARCAELSAYMPPGMARICAERGMAEMSRLGGAILSFFRLEDPASLGEIAEMRGGLNHRLHNAAMEARNLDELFALAATKKYTSARIRRAVIFGMTGVKPGDLKSAPDHTLLLAANQTGRDLLNLYSANPAAQIKIVTKPAAAPHSAQSTLSKKAESLYTLSTNPRLGGGHYLRCKPRMV